MSVRGRVLFLPSTILNLLFNPRGRAEDAETARPTERFRRDNFILSADN